MIQLGDNGHHFHAHESVLRRSPKLSEDIAAAQSKKRVSLHNLLPLMPHNPVAFEQMLEYLYNDRVQLTKSQPSASARMDEIRELFSLAKYYLLPELQKHVVKLFSDSNILNKVTSAKFFDWAEDMYSEELDIENGPFKSYFALVAPTLLCKVTPGLMEEVCRMVKVGGTFAVELFKACHRVRFFFLPIRHTLLIETGFDYELCRQGGRLARESLAKRDSFCPV